jgi:hypothetical protein
MAALEHFMHKRRRTSNAEKDEAEEQLTMEQSKVPSICEFPGTVFRDHAPKPYSHG